MSRPVTRFVADICDRCGYVEDLGPRSTVSASVSIHVHCGAPMRGVGIAELRKRDAMDPADTAPVSWRYEKKASQ